ncbi:MAG TPA: MlaD family protein [Acidimicrobiales bacterium]|jgi:phospholipid/cholesterol/gamma-HCH transport system substrate-binding protein|nr:MlaD family protein [Acidimicrobiales bacterium]
MSRAILARLIALVVITLAGVYYISFDAIGVHVFSQPYKVNAVFPAIVNGQPSGAGGLYSDAYVTYRGVEVGKVGSLQLHQNEVVAVLDIDHGTKIPKNVSAHVKELTAAAEQYVDLVPEGSDPPGQYLTSGDKITDTTIPISVGTLLNSLNSLVNSLSPADLNTLTSSLATGLQDAGGNLHQIIADGNTLATALQTAIPGTQQLINAGNTVLSTFNATSNDFAQFSTNLDLLSQQVKQSNSDLVALLQNGAAAGTALNNFLKQNGNATIGLINDLSASTNVAYQRQPAIQALFEVLPLFATDVSETVSNGQVHFQLDFNTASPVCPYIPTLPTPTQVDGNPADLNRNCSTEAPNLLQRGADKAPTPANP